MFSLHLIFDFVIPSNSQSFYLAKDYTTIFFLFVAIPLVMVVKNENMLNFVRNRFLKFAALEISANHLVGLYSKFKMRNNVVDPVQSINELIRRRDLERV